jgi:hypothetical protein
MQSRTCPDYAEAPPIFAAQLQKYNSSAQKHLSISIFFLSTFQNFRVKAGKKSAV